MPDLQRKNNSLKNILQILVLLGMVIVFSYCVKDTAIGKKQLSFFDLKAYFETQKRQLVEIEKFKKTTIIDGKQIEKELDSIDFNLELIVFEESDINKIAWIDKYLVDSVYDKNGLLNKLIYKATDDKLRTQQMLISFSQNAVDTIRIFNNSSGSVADLEQRLLYIPTYGYTIESKQKTTISAQHVVTVAVQFLE